MASFVHSSQPRILRRVILGVKLQKNAEYNKAAV